MTEGLPILVRRYVQAINVDGRRCLVLAAVVALCMACGGSNNRTRRPQPRPVHQYPHYPPRPAPPPVSHPPPAPPPPSTPPIPPIPPGAGASYEALTTQNGIRHASGAAPLRWSPALQAEAQHHANGTRPSCRPGPHTQPKHQMLLKTLHSPMRASDVIRRWATKSNMHALLVGRRFSEMACAQTMCGNNQIWICLYR